MDARPFAAAANVVFEHALDVPAWRTIGAARPFPVRGDRARDLGVVHRPRRRRSDRLGVIAAA